MHSHSHNRAAQLHPTNEHFHFKEHRKQWIAQVIVLLGLALLVGIGALLLSWVA